MQSVSSSASIDTYSVSADLYTQHLQEKVARFHTLLKAAGLTDLLIGSGNTKTQFQDDLFYPFKANPYFKECVPLNKRAGSFLHLSVSNSKPTLYD